MPHSPLVTPLLAYRFTTSALTIKTRLSPCWLHEERVKVVLRQRVCNNNKAIYQELENSRHTQGMLVNFLKKNVRG